MAAYQLVNGGGVLRAADGAAIPADPGNRDWREYLAWVAAGNAADPAPPVPPRPKRLTDILDALPKARQQALLVAAGANPGLLD